MQNCEKRCTDVPLFSVFINFSELQADGISHKIFLQRYTFSAMHQQDYRQKAFLRKKYAKAFGQIEIL